MLKFGELLKSVRHFVPGSFVGWARGASQDDGEKKKDDRKENNGTVKEKTRGSWDNRLIGGFLC